MSEQPQQNEPLTPAPVEQNVAELIKKMHQQLVYLEKKIDTLISQSSGRPSSEKRFSKPFRSFGPTHRSSGREHGNAAGGKSFDRGHHFEKRQGGEKSGFDQKKKPFYFKQRDRG